MFTQRNEEEYILRFFGNDKGRFLDIGAYDGVCFSTTRALVLKGWEGVCVEPSPTVLPALRKLYQNDSNVELLECAISNITGTVDFYDSGGDMVSSTNKAHMKLWKEKGGCTFNKIKVNSLTTLDLFKQVGYNFDFITLDVEGTNLDVLCQFPLDKLKKVRMLCVEFDFQSEAVLCIVEPFGFILYHQTAENLLLVRK